MADVVSEDQVSYEVGDDARPDTEIEISVEVSNSFTTFDHRFSAVILDMKSEPKITESMNNLTKDAENIQTTKSHSKGENIHGETGGSDQEQNIDTWMDFYSRKRNICNGSFFLICGACAFISGLTIALGGNDFHAASVFGVIFGLWVLLNSVVIFQISRTWKVNWLNLAFWMSVVTSVISFAFLITLSAGLSHFDIGKQNVSSTTILCKEPNCDLQKPFIVFAVIILALTCILFFIGHHIVCYHLTISYCDPCHTEHRKILHSVPPVGGEDINRGNCSVESNRPDEHLNSRRIWKYSIVIAVISVTTIPFTAAITSDVGTVVIFAYITELLTFFTALAGIWLSNRISENTLMIKMLAITSTFMVVLITAFLICSGTVIHYEMNKNQCYEKQTMQCSKYSYTTRLVVYFVILLLTVLCVVIYTCISLELYLNLWKNGRTNSSKHTAEPPSNPVCHDQGDSKNKTRKADVETESA